MLILAAALLLDRIAGEPEWLWSRVPHPILALGRSVEWLDRRLNREDLTFAAGRRRGVVAVLVLAGVAGGSGLLLARLFGAAPLGWLAEVAVAAAFLAQKSLLDHVAAVARALRKDGVAAGRRHVSLIVGRDVTALDEAGVARAAIESLAENFSDAVVAPAFWYAILGLPGLILFKAASTADSMIGHRSPRYEAFGWAAARLDDLLNFVPARLSVLAIAGAAALTGGKARQAIAAALRDAAKHRSPNAGWPEAAAAGALGIALGGPRRYGDLAVDGAWLNAAGRRQADRRDINKALRLTDIAWGLVVAAVLIGGLATWRS